MFIISIIELFLQNLGVFLIFMKKMDISLGLSFYIVNMWCKKCFRVEIRNGDGGGSHSASIRGRL
jgi:hypothetical protein